MKEKLSLPKGTHCCNKGCARCGNLTEKEAQICYEKCLCDECKDDMRKICYEKYIIKNDT